MQENTILTDCAKQDLNKHFDNTKTMLVDLAKPMKFRDRAKISITKNSEYKFEYSIMKDSKGHTYKTNKAVHLEFFHNGKMQNFISRIASEVDKEKNVIDVYMLNDQLTKIVYNIDRINLENVLPVLNKKDFLKAIRQRDHKAVLKQHQDGLNSFAEYLNELKSMILDFEENNIPLAYYSSEYKEKFDRVEPEQAIYAINKIIDYSLDLLAE